MSDSVITVAEAATRLGISPRQVRTRAAAANVGARLNPRMIVFTPAEFEILSKRRPSGWPKGRPRKESTMSTTYCTDSGELRITFHIPAEREGTGSGSDECAEGRDITEETERVERRARIDAGDATLTDVAMELDSFADVVRRHARALGIIRRGGIDGRTHVFDRAAVHALRAAVHADPKSLPG